MVTAEDGPPHLGLQTSRRPRRGGFRVEPRCRMASGGLEARSSMRTAPISSPARRRHCSFKFDSTAPPPSRLETACWTRPPTTQRLRAPSSGATLHRCRSYELQSRQLTPPPGPTSPTTPAPRPRHSEAKLVMTQDQQSNSAGNLLAGKKTAKKSPGLRPGPRSLLASSRK
jgi:hypothetical protein